MKRRGAGAEAEHRRLCSAEIPAAQTRADHGLCSLRGLRHLRGARRAGPKSRRVNDLSEDVFCWGVATQISQLLSNSGILAESPQRENACTSAQSLVAQWMGNKCDRSCGFPQIWRLTSNMSRSS